jgi:hypothetical protein
VADLRHADALKTAFEFNGLWGVLARMMPNQPSADHLIADCWKKKVAKTGTTKPKEVFYAHP